MNYFSMAGLILVYLIILIPIHELLNADAKERIRAYLKERNYRVVDITWSHYLGSRHGHYVVKYLTENNELYRASCHLDRQSQIFWSEPRFVWRYTAEQAEYVLSGRAEGEQSELPVRLPGKEELINSLTSGYKFERMWAVKKLHELETVEASTVQIVKDMVLDDPDPDVRQAAREAIQSREM
jgi:hypothetical protein